MSAEHGEARNATGAAGQENDFPPQTVAARELVVQNPGRFTEAGVGRLVPWLETLLASEIPHATSLTVRMVNDREMRRLNATYALRDEATDVLSFPGELEMPTPEPAAAEPGHLGDIVISVPMARRQAATRGHSVERELRVLILHGILHCLGYDHTTDNGTMEHLEARLRARWIDHG